MFEPANGERARWRILYDALKDAPYESVLTFEHMAELCDCSVAQARQGIPGAMKALERSDQKTLVSVRNVGYRIALPAEHEGLGRQHIRRSARQLIKSQRRLSSADRSQLDEEQRRRVDSLETTVSRHSDILRRLERTTAKHDRLIRETKLEIKETGAAVGERVDRLERLLQRAGLSTDEASEAAEIALDNTQASSTEA